MADNTGIGDLIISVGADLSAFEAALDQLPGLAAGVAQQVNAAFQAASTFVGCPFHVHGPSSRIARGCQLRFFRRRLSHVRVVRSVGVRCHGYR